MLLKSLKPVPPSTLSLIVSQENYTLPPLTITSFPISPPNFWNARFTPQIGLDCTAVTHYYQN